MLRLEGRVLQGEQWGEVDCEDTGSVKTHAGLERTGLRMSLGVNRGIHLDEIMPFETRYTIQSGYTAYTLLSPVMLSSVTLSKSRLAPEI